MRLKKILKLTHQKFATVIKCIVLLPIEIYKYCISPLLPQSCIFQPTCSEYAKQAIKKYPLYKAIYLILRRILRCHTFYKGDRYDPL